jgi:hypothetical protein
MPICEMTARLAFTGDSRPVSLPDGRRRTSEPYASLSCWLMAAAMLKPEEPVS